MRCYRKTFIIRLERGSQQGPVTISTSTDDSFTDLSTHVHPFDRIVFPDDPEAVYSCTHVTREKHHRVIPPNPLIHLADLGIKVSTGPVVDFRLKKHLRHARTWNRPLALPLPFQQ